MENNKENGLDGKDINKDRSTHESSYHFCFRSDEIGHLTHSCVIDRLAVMTKNEVEHYDYESFVPSHHSTIREL